MHIIDRIRFWALGLLLFSVSFSEAQSLHIGEGREFTTIKAALEACNDGDTLFIHSGVFKEGNIEIKKSVHLVGVGKAVLDGESKYEILSIRHSDVSISELIIRNSRLSSLDDPAAVKVYNARNVRIENNILEENFFGIYLQYAVNSIVKNNKITSSQKREYNSGNGIHCWNSDSLQIIGNKITGHRDGIYFEFVSKSIIWRNIAKDNIRYGLHFMFSHENAYITNYFKNNGAGVAVMFTKKVTMINNTFEDNWGDSAYGVLFKELTDCYLSGNIFVRNTTGIFFDGSNRIIIENNTFKANGWGMRMQANCVDNEIRKNNFIGNTFDVATNGSLTLNHFSENYWDKYEGYDLNKDKIGDVPFRPLSLYSVIVEKNPPAMLLYRSFMITLLDKSERILPSLTPENFVDKRPHMVPYLL